MRVVEGIARIDGDHDDGDHDDGDHDDGVGAFVDRLAGIGDAHGVTVQAFDARYVVGRAHLERAVALADRAFAREENVARDRGVEVLLYAAGRRQIDRAFEMGVGDGETPIVVVVDGASGGVGGGAAAEDAAAEDAAAEDAAAGAVEGLLEPAETLEAFDEGRVRAFFDVGERELAATDASLADLVLERVALLDVEK